MRVRRSMILSLMGNEQRNNLLCIGQYSQTFLVVKTPKFVYSINLGSIGITLTHQKWINSCCKLYYNNSVMTIVCYCIS